jgi:hypothetical protein
MKGERTMTSRKGVSRKLAAVAREAAIVARRLAMQRADTTPTNPTTFDYAGIKTLAEELRRPVKTLFALSTSNDPFYTTPTRRTDAEWFAKLWHKFGMAKGSHLRGLHYRIISQRTPILMRDGTPYRNTEGCWQDLVSASKDARYLDLVSADDLADRRNDAPVTNIRETIVTPVAFVDDNEIELEDLEEMPEPPRAYLSDLERTQPYQIEIWVEKSTMNDVLEPIAEQYGVTLITGTGEISVTHCNLCIDRAEEDGRPARILYISDFDPAGLSMPVAAARKIEFFARRRNPDLDIQLHPIVLTPDQCRQFQLPRTPIKDTELRAESFEEQHGEGATELDALEALHPGELARIVRREINRFYDRNLDARTRAAAEPVRAELDSLTVAVHKQHRKDIDGLRKEYAEIVAARARWAKRAKPVWHAITESIEAEIEPIVEGVEWSEAKEASEYPDALYDSTRDYVEQMNRYKAFQGRPTERKSRKDAS